MPYVDPTAEKARCQRYYAANRDRWRCSAAAARLARFGLTSESYTALISQQHGACAVCRAAFDGRPRSVHIDHDHTTGEVRGLLCGSCNRAIGLMSDDPALLVRAATYVGES